MDKKRFLEVIKNTIENEKDLDNINLFNKIKINNFIRHLQNKFIKTINYSNANNSVITIHENISEEDWNYIFGKNSEEREKNLSYFKQKCNELEIFVKFHYVVYKSKIFDDYIELDAWINNPCYKKTK